MVTINTLLIGLALLSILIYYLFFSINRGRKYPPGPRGLPYVGNLFSIGNKPHLVFTEWAKKYGPIVQVQLGRTRCIVLNDVKIIKEAFNDPILCGRPKNKVFNIIPGGKIGILSSDGEDWTEQRRFTLRTLRDFGFGRKSMESMIMEEVMEIIEWLKEGAGSPISVNRKFGLSVINSLWQILTSERYNHDDPKLNKILDTVTEAFIEIAETGIPIFFPELAEKFPGLTGWNKLVKALGPLTGLYRVAVEERLKDPSEGNPMDFMDVYLQEIKKTTNPNSSFYEEVGIKSMKAVIGDLHLAGSDTTSTTLTWAVLYLMKHPEIQNKLREEIDKIIGKSRFPTLADKPNMPYTEAVTTELLRISSIVPMGVFHTAMADTTFHGYFIPKDAMIIANQYMVHHNLETWGEPEAFRPDRFLSPDGETVLKHESIIPFSFGRRACLGENLARDELFLFMTSIFQRFIVQPDPASPASLEPKPGFVAQAELFTVIMKDRFE